MVRVSSRRSRPGQLFHRHYAAIMFAAHIVLKLDGGMRNLEVLFEHVVELVQDAGALGRRNVNDANVASQSAAL